MVINSKLSKAVQLSNLGDVGAKFSWDTIFCDKYFGISPKKGYLPAHEDMQFEITFHPNVLDTDIRFKVKCNIEDADPLFLSLRGKCIEQPKENVQTLKFDTVVRTSKSQKVQLKNPSSKPWKVKAVISSSSDHNFFLGKDFLEVPANGAADYEITYTPLTMTTSPETPDIKEESHEGRTILPSARWISYPLQADGKVDALPAPPDTFDTRFKRRASRKVMKFSVAARMRLPEAAGAVVALVAGAVRMISSAVRPTRRRSFARGHSIYTGVRFFIVPLISYVTYIPFSCEGVEVDELSGDRLVIENGLVLLQELGAHFRIFSLW